MLDGGRTGLTGGMGRRGTHHTTHAPRSRNMQTDVTQRLVQPQGFALEAARFSSRGGTKRTVTRVGLGKLVLPNHRELISGVALRISYGTWLALTKAN